MTIIATRCVWKRMESTQVKELKRIFQGILYFLENKLMRLYSNPASPYAPIFQYAPIFEQPLPPVIFSRLKKSYLRDYLAHKNGSPIKM